MVDYERYHYDKELLVRTAVEVGAVEVNPISDLEIVRGQINKYLLERSGAADGPRLSSDWCFVDSEFRFWFSWFASSINRSRFIPLCANYNIHSSH